jgi:hypothetical protein
VKHFHFHAKLIFHRDYDNDFDYESDCDSVYGSVFGLIIDYFIFRFPERLLPGFLDIVGHSHQWWHVFIFIGNFENLIFVFFGLFLMKI